MSTQLPNRCINGEAGVGKSRYIKENFNDPTKYLLLAPTGVAACSIDGKTINSFFGLGKDSRDANVEWIVETFPDEKRKRLLSITTIVIDEYYVAALIALTKMHEILQLILNNKQPFGGKQIILLGDIRQLPAIEKPSFYGSPLFKSLNIQREDLQYDPSKKPRLEPNYRELCNYLRLGRTGDQLVDFIATFPGNPQPTNNFAVYYTNADVNTHNDTEIKRLPGKMMTVKYPKFDPKTGKSKTKIFKYKAGMRIMLRRNYDLNKKLYNGTIGKLINFATSTNTAGETICKLTIETDGKTHTIPNCTKWVPAYAMTIHKCQGLTLDDIDIYIRPHQLYTPDATKLLYVSITRVRSADKVYIKLLDD